MNTLQLQNPEISFNGLEFLESHGLYEIQFKNFVGHFASVFNYLYKMAKAVKVTYGDDHGFEIISCYASIRALQKDGMQYLIPSEWQSSEQIVNLDGKNSYIIDAEEVKFTVKEMYQLIEKYTN